MAESPEALALKVMHFRVQFRATDRLQLPDFSGSAWRGLFGRAFKQALCTTGLPQCHSCERLHDCAHSEVFEAPLPPGSTKLRLYPSVPHPYVIRPGQHGVVNPGEVGHVDFLLFGRAERHFSPIVEAMQQAGSIGVGAGRGHFSVTEVEQLSLTPDASVIARHQPGDVHLAELHSGFLHYTAPKHETARLELTSPLRIRINQKYMSAGAFSMRAFCATLLRRYTSLCYFHSGFEPELEFKALLEAAEQLTVSNQELIWVDARRYSSRQGTQVPIGGITGNLEVSGPQLSRLWPLLWCGQWLHVGKGAVMGLGQYRLTPASLPKN